MTRVTSSRLSRRRLLLSLGVTPFLATACGQRLPLGGVVARPPSKVTLIHGARGGFNPLGERVRGLIRAVPAETGVEFEVASYQFITGPDAPDLGQQYVTYVEEMARSEKGADLVLLDGSQLPPLSQAGTLMDLNRLLKGEKWYRTEEWWPTVLNAGRSRGKQLAVPLQVNPDVLVYSMDHFKAANAELPTPRWTWQDALRVAQSLTRNGRWGFFVAPTPSLFLGLAWQQGATVVSEDGSAVDLTEDGTLAALELLADMIGRHKVAPPLNDESLRGQLTQLRYDLSASHVAMTVLPTGGNVWWRRRGSGITLEISEVPRGTHTVTFGSADLMMGIAARTADVDRAVTALKALSDASRQTVWCPARRREVAMRKADILLTDADEAVLLSSLETLRVLPGGLPPTALAVLQRELLAPVLSGKKAPAQAAREAQSAIQSLLGPSRKGGW